LDQLIDILQIPQSCRVNKKVTKAFFKRNFELTTAERNILDDPTQILQIDWIASVKPENSNIKAKSVDLSTFEEIQIFNLFTGCASAPGKKKIAELIQKYIPYHILLCIFDDTSFVLNTCEKRINQNDSAKRTVEKFYFTNDIDYSSPSVNQKSFIDSMAFAELDKQNLKTFYDSYTARIIALQTSDYTGLFNIRKYDRCKLDVQYIENIIRLQTEIITLQNQAKKENQLNIQVELNNAIQVKRQEIITLEDFLKS
jgi:hypothetical protein